MTWSLSLKSDSSRAEFWAKPRIDSRRSKEWEFELEMYFYCLFIVRAVICLMCFISCMNYLMYSCTIDLFLRIISFICLFRFPLLLKFNSFTCCLFVWLIIYCMYIIMFIILLIELCVLTFLSSYTFIHISLHHFCVVCVCVDIQAWPFQTCLQPCQCWKVLSVLRHRGWAPAICQFNPWNKNTVETTCCVFLNQGPRVQNEATGALGHKTKVFLILHPF